MLDLPLGTGRTVSDICSQSDFYAKDNNSIPPVVILQRRELERTCRPFSRNPIHHAAQESVGFPVIDRSDRAT